MYLNLVCSCIFIKKNLNSHKTSFILFLLFMWSVYAAWATNEQTSSITTSDNITSDSITGYDQLLLPFLILFTVFAIYILIKKKGKDK